MTEVFHNTQPHAGPGGSALFYSLGAKRETDPAIVEPHPNTILFVPGHPVLACDANGSSTPNWRPDGRAAAMGSLPVTVVDIDHGCRALWVRDVAWLPSGMISLTKAGIETATGALWPVEGPSRLVQVQDEVYLDGDSGVWIVRDGGLERLGDRALYGGDRRFADGVCFGVPASGYRCWRGSDALPPVAALPMREGFLSAVGPDMAWVRRGGRNSLVNTITGEERSLPPVPIAVDEIRVRGEVVDLFTSTVWYTWTGGEASHPREYE